IQEFNREFIAYWSQRSTRYRRELSVLSLVHPFYNKEDLFYFYISNIRSYVFAESKDQLTCWLRNIGLKISYEQIDESTLWVLEKTWVPSEFPTTAAMFIDGIKDELLASHVRSNRNLPLLIKASTPTGVVFVAVLLKT